MGPVLKQAPLSLGTEQLAMYEISALDYLDYLDYLDANPLPPQPEVGDPAALRKWLRDTRRVDLLQISRLVALALYRGLNVQPDAVQDMIQQDWPLALTQAAYLEVMKFVGLASDKPTEPTQPGDNPPEPLTPKS